MTLPDERYRAVKEAEKFLLELLNPKLTPRVPRAVRERAHRVLRHFPRGYEMDKVSSKLPEIFERVKE